MFTTQHQFKIGKPVQLLAHSPMSSYWLSIEAGTSDRTPGNSNYSGVQS